MHELTVGAVFSAAHAIKIRGTPETLHGHDWAVTVAVEGPNLDPDGLLCDFHEIERALREVIAPFQNRNLNDTPPFDRLNPTAEHVARHIADRLAAAIGHVLPPAARIARVSVTEAPGCVATYRPPID